jgi:hypothetical protein
LAGLPMSARAQDFGGVWHCDDGGTYYIRQIGNVIWWFGEASQTNTGWSNVARGAFEGGEIRLEWVDVPKGSILGGGILVLHPDSDHRLVATTKSGGFGGNVWTR